MQMPIEAEYSALRLLDQHAEPALKIIGRAISVAVLERQAAQVGSEAPFADLEIRARVALVIVLEPLIERLVAVVLGFQAIHQHARQLAYAIQFGRDIAEAARIIVALLPYQQCRR